MVSIKLEKGRFSPSAIALNILISSSSKRTLTVFFSIPTKSPVYILHCMHYNHKQYIAIDCNNIISIAMEKHAMQ